MVVFLNVFKWKTVHSLQHKSGLNNWKNLCDARGYDITVESQSHTDHHILYVFSYCTFETDHMHHTPITLGSYLHLLHHVKHVIPP